MSLIEDINKYLKQFGSNHRGQPVFRMIWSEDQRENRRGVYNDFKGALFLRTITEVRRVKKYSYLKDKWIIERFVPPEQYKRDELPDSGEGGYEPIWVFQDRNGNYLEPNLEVAAIVMEALDNPRSSSEIVRSDEQEQIRQDQEIDKALINITDEEYPIADKLHYGEAVSFAFPRINHDKEFNRRRK